MAANGVGASLERKEDDRLLRGKGRYVGDIRMAGQVELAFVRSPVAHGTIRAVRAPAGAEDRVFTAADMAGVRGILARSGLRGFKVSEQPVLAATKVRFVGEPVAMCMAGTRAEAEDLAAAVALEIDELPANVDMLAAARPDAPRVHDEWSDNLFLETFIDGEIDRIAASAPIRVSRTLRTSRQCMAPLEGKGCVAVWDRTLEQLALWTSTPMPHLVRTGLAECLGTEDRRGPARSGTGLTTSASTAPAPGRSARTCRRACPIAASRAPASAARWS